MVPVPGSVWDRSPAVMYLWGWDPDYWLGSSVLHIEAAGVEGLNTLFIHLPATWEEMATTAASGQVSFPYLSLHMATFGFLTRMMASEQLPTS